MSTEWGVFSDEGCIEAQCWSEREAQIRLADYYNQGERHLSIHQICPDHPDQSNDYCDECNTEEECEHEAVDDDHCVACGEEVA